MSNRKEPKYYIKNKSQYKYPMYSESETSLASTWEYDHDQNNKKHVKFEEGYDYSSHDDFYGGGNKNVYSYPFLHDSNNMYEAEKEFYDYDSEGSQYTQYHQSPQHIRYTGTDSALTIQGSDYEYDSYDYQPKVGQRYSNYYKNSKKKNNDLKKSRDVDTSSPKGSLGVYFVRQPTHHQKFKYKDETDHSISNTSEPEIQGESVTETEEENYKPSGNKGTSYKIYTAKTSENTAFKPFNEENSQQNQEKLISVTNYDNIPLIAFKNHNTTVSLQKSQSRVVYLPVIVMQNDGNMLAPNKINTELLNNKALENIQIYPVNTGGKNIFDNFSENSNDKVLKTDSTVSNPKQASTILNEKTEARKSSKKGSFTRLHSILRSPGKKRSFSAIKTNSKINNSTIKKNEINSKPSIISVISTKSNSKMQYNDENRKKSSRTSESQAQDLKELEGKTSNTFGKVQDKKRKSRSKSETRNKSQKSLLGSGNYSQVGPPKSEPATDVDIGSSRYNEISKNDIGIEKVANKKPSVLNKQKTGHDASNTSKTPNTHTKSHIENSQNENDMNTKRFEKENEQIVVGGSKKSIVTHSKNPDENNVSTKKSTINKLSNDASKQDNRDKQNIKTQQSDTNKIVQGKTSTIAKENTTVTGKNISQQKSMIQGQDINTLVEKDGLKGNQLSQIQTYQSRRSLVKEKKTVEEPFSRESKIQNKSSTILVQDKIVDKKSKDPILDSNSTTKGITNSTVKENTPCEKTCPQTSRTKSKDIMTQDDQLHPESKHSLAATGKPNALKSKSLVKENQSRDNINTDDKKSPLKETGSPTKEIKPMQHRKGEIKKVENKANEVSNDRALKENTAKGKRSSVARVKRVESEVINADSVFPKNIQEEKIDARTNEVKSNVNVSSTSVVLDKREKEGSTANKQVLKEHKDIKGQNSSAEVNKNSKGVVKNGQKTTSIEKQSSKDSKTKGGMYISVSEQKRESKNSRNLSQDQIFIQNDQKGILTDQKNTNRTLSRNCQRKSETNKSPRNCQSQTSISNGVAISKEKTDSKLAKAASSDYFGNFPIEFGGYDLATILRCFFQVSQFILGVSTYDKVIEVFGNFN